MDINDLFGPIAANDNDKRVCLRCGGEVTGDKRKKFCSAACRNSSRSANPGWDHKHICEGCSIEFEGRFTAKYCSKTCGRRHKDSLKDNSARHAARDAKAAPRKCGHCGEDYRSARPEQLFCGKSCSMGARMSDPIALDGMRVTRALGYGTHIRPASYSVYRPICGCCGIRFTAKTNLSRLCSDECKRIDRLARTRAKSAANDNKPDATCRECGTIFTRDYGDTRKEFCSKLCATRTHKRSSRKVERARLRGAKVESVDPTKVFIRDGWKCQLCGVKTPKKLRGTTRPNAPELDHIMPLSLGGEHSYRNTHCACRACNGAKGATPMGQMLMFG